jgi:hypothetical protein
LAKMAVSAAKIADSTAQSCQVENKVEFIRLASYATTALAPIGLATTRSSNGHNRQGLHRVRMAPEAPDLSWSSAPGAKAVGIRYDCPDFRRDLGRKRSKAEMDG